MNGNHSTNDALFAQTSDSIMQRACSLSITWGSTAFLEKSSAIQGATVSTIDYIVPMTPL